ncbi:hypothetical protein HYALB_00008358 [Hymenoscyphus albidus]|uniref:Oxidase ustYa n=1 Tax=Hymenoscyphus albidus TaxID=595503 RepID=A0A9N9Q7L5_9HELO|nr:hypothetical protein HYALB_00008358 [Hymenoscyphus albidus]
MDESSKPFLASNGNADEDLETVQSSAGYSRKNQVIAWRTFKAQISIVIVLALALGVALGYNSQQIFSAGLTSKILNGLILPPGEVTETWEHNLLFSQSPTAESEAAWNDLMPIGRGFIRPPEVTPPEITSIVAFHQLHCLHAILMAYYATEENLGRVLEGKGVNPDPQLYGTRIHTHHIRHCFDYLRRAIMCAADTNLEVIDPTNHTTDGWGQAKKCRNFTLVREYAERWAPNEDTGIIT